MRNQYSFTASPIHPTAVIDKPTLAIFEWNATKIYTSSDGVPGYTHRTWFPPAKEFYKLNFDGSMHLGTMTAWIGGIIRNHNGELVVAYTSSIKAENALEAEVQALYHGVIQCKVNHVKKVVIEGDCLVLVENIQRQEMVSWNIMHLWWKQLQALEGIPAWSIRGLGVDRRMKWQTCSLSSITPHLPLSKLIFHQQSLI